jgi:hypothetical protein
MRTGRSVIVARPSDAALILRVVEPDPARSKNYLYLWTRIRNWISEPYPDSKPNMDPGKHLDPNPSQVLFPTNNKIAQNIYKLNFPIFSFKKFRRSWVLRKNKVVYNVL